MTYAAKQDLIDRFGEKELRELTDRVNRPPTTIDDTILGRALADADALANSYLGKLYSLPVSPAPEILVKICADVARYFLHGKAVDKDGAVAIAYRDALRWLGDVAKGTVALDAAGVPTAQAGGGAIRANPSGRVMRRDTLKGL